MLCLLAGLAVGSFLNVVVWRVPRGESVVHPPSACPRCGHPIRSRDNIPVVSWWVLRGRCRDCGEPISRRYPAVEAATGALFVGAAFVAGLSWELPALLWFVAIGVALTLIDLDTHRLPNAIVLPSYAVVPALLALASWNPGGDPDWGALVRAAVGGAAMYVVYLVVMLVSALFYAGGGMGFGDVKLAGLVGMYLGWYGWGALAVGWFAAFLLGGILSIALLAAGRVGRKGGVPFGPWIIAGGAFGIVAGEAVWNAYLGAF